MTIVGLDFDGIMHDSCKYAHAAFCETLRGHGLPGIAMHTLRAHFGSDWSHFFNATGVPQELHGIWKDEYQKRYDNQPIGPLIPGTRELLDHILTKHGRRGLMLITNEQPERVHRFFAENNIETLESAVRCAYSGKVRLLEEHGVTDYVGDTIGDGEACIAAANRPRFIGVAHPPGYNLPEMLYTFKAEHPEHRIDVVQSLFEAKVLL